MEKQEFFDEVKDILDLITQYGINNFEYKGDIFEVIKNIKRSEEFVAKVHEGFMYAQKKIIEDLLNVLNSQKAIKNNIKNLRRIKVDKGIIEEQNGIYNTLKNQEIILRKLADTIAWQLIGEDITVIRRLYCANSTIDISNSNLEYDMNVINQIFEKDKTIFPLLSDITSFMQVGDVLIKDYLNNSLGIIELKEGKVNEQIEEILDKYNKTKCSYMIYNEIKDKDTNFMKQFERYIKQQIKLNSTAETINKGEGIDNATGLKVKIHNDVFVTNDFYDDINEMLEEVDEKNYSLKVIEGCLLVGVYNNKNMPIDSAFKLWKMSLNIKFPEVDITSSLAAPIAYPLFLHPFRNEDKLKLIFREKSIKLTLDINGWLELMKDFEMNYRCLSKKETSRINSKSSKCKLFAVEGQALEVEYNKRKMIIGNGFFGRILCQFVTPKSAIRFLRNSLEQERDAE